MKNSKIKFDLPKDVTYLNAAYMGPLSNKTVEIGKECVQKKSTPWRITLNDFFEERITVKKLFKSLIGAKSYHNIAIIPSVSYGINTVANGLKSVQKNEIIIIEDQFPSNVYPWLELQKKGFKIILAPKDNTAILDKINSNTAVVAMSHCHWVDGYLFDIKKIGAKCKNLGSLFVVDATQSLGAVPIHVRECNIDALIVAGYKWLMGPYSIGLAYYSDKIISNFEPLEHNWINREKSQDFSNLTNYTNNYQPGAEAFSVGESSNFVLLPMLKNSLEEITDVGIKNINKHVSLLSSKLIKGLRKIGWDTPPLSEFGGHLFGVKIPANINVDNLKEYLQSKNIMVSYRADKMRISIHLYNTKKDIKKILKALKKYT